jgi:hypothetical protein
MSCQDVNLFISFSSLSNVIARVLLPKQSPFIWKSANGNEIATLPEEHWWLAMTLVWIEYNPALFAKLTISQ